MDMNSLQQWMDFYKQKGLGPPDVQFTSPFGGVGLGMDRNQAALQFAMRMAQNQQPSFGMPQSQNFFANLGGPPSAATIGANPMDARVNAAFDRPYVQNQAPQMGNNYLARILK